MTFDLADKARRLNSALRILVAAAEDSLLSGQHDGDCDNDPDIPESGPCYQHIAASERRERALELAIETAKRELL